MWLAMIVDVEGRTAGGETTWNRRSPSRNRPPSRLAAAPTSVACALSPHRVGLAFGARFGDPSYWALLAASIGLWHIDVRRHARS